MICCYLITISLLTCRSYFNCCLYIQIVLPDGLLAVFSLCSACHVVCDGSEQNSQVTEKFSFPLIFVKVFKIFVLAFCSTEKKKVACSTVMFVLQIICTSTHNVSFAQVRGSVPVYWSQPGYKYRPPPRLDRGICFALCSSKMQTQIHIGVHVEVWCAH